MNMKKTLLALVLVLPLASHLSPCLAQHDSIPESDPAIVQRIDDWQDRIYCYERDAPGHFTVPAYYGRGYALSLVGSFRHSWPGLRLKSYLRASWTAWPWSEKPKPGVAGLRVQLMLDF